MPFDHVHLDPSQDPSEIDQAAFDLCRDLWDRLREFRNSYPRDEFLAALIAHLETQLVSAGLILTMKMRLGAGR
jgi:hypothetical protein